MTNRNNQSLDDLNPYKWELEVEEQLEKIDRNKKHNREDWEAVIDETKTKFSDLLSRQDAMLFTGLVEMMHEIDEFDKHHS
jgi:hypothetical protein